MEEEKKYAGIGGWLLLIIFSYLYSGFNNFKIAKDVYNLYADGTMSLISNKISKYYNAQYAFILNFELIFSLLIVIGALGALIFLFMKKKFYPKYAIILIIVSHSIALFDLIIVVGANLKIPVITIIQIICGVISGVIWIFYFLKSNRVKQTFIR